MSNHLFLPFINQERKRGSRSVKYITNIGDFIALQVLTGIFPLTAQSQNSLVVSEELDPHPAPEVEEDVDGDGDGQQQAVEAQAAAAGAALREVLVHRGGVEQTKEGHYWDQPHHHGQGEHACRWVLIQSTTGANKYLSNILHGLLTRWRDFRTSLWLWSNTIRLELSSYSATGVQSGL